MAHYLPRAQFEELILRVQRAKQAGQADRELQNELLEVLYPFVRTIWSSFRFHFLERDDAIQEGVLLCFQKIHLFDPLLGRAFNYCTTIVLNHFRQMYRNHKRFNDLRLTYFKEHSVPPPRPKPHRHREED